MSGAMLVQDELLDHYKYPRCRTPVDNPTFTVELTNYSCGDRVVVSGRVEKGCLAACGFQGEGCVLSQAAASMLLEKVQGQPLAALETIDASVMQERMGICVGPTRLRCVLLALEALRRGALQMP